MKIIFVTPYYEPSVGGVQHYVKALAEALADTHEVSIITTTCKDANKIETLGKITIYRLPIFAKLSNTPFHPLWHWQLKQLFKKIKPDVINAHAPVPGLADAAIMAAKNIPVVFTYHAGSMQKGSGIIDVILRFYEKHQLPRLFKKATTVTAVYPAFVKKLTTKPVLFTPPPIDTKLFTPKASVTKSYDVLFGGRIERSSDWKGLDILLQAIALAPQPITLRVVGDGDALTHYKELAKTLGIKNQVTFSGRLDQNQLPTAYRQAKIVVLPSKTEAESFGMVLAQAMACGVPVIGSRIGGIPTVITDNVSGRLVEPNNAIALSECIVSLLTDKKQQAAFGKAARQRVEQNFSLQRRVKETIDLLKQATQPAIVHVAANYPPRLGGLEKVVEQLAQQQQTTGRSVQIITSSLGYRPDYRDSVPVLRLKALEIAHTPLIFGLFWHLLKLPKNTIVHLHAAQAYIPEMVWLASKLKGFRYIAHVHLDIAPSGAFGFLLKVYKPLIFKPVLRDSAQVVVFSDEQKQTMINLYNLSHEKVGVIPNGVDQKFYHNATRHLHTKPRLLFVGRLDAQKNVSLLLHALDSVSDKFETNIVGEGELRNQLEALSRRLRLKNVYFHGRKDGEALYNFYKQADIFVLPSEREGMPLVLLEALAMGLPIVGTNVTGIRDLVTSGKNGLLVPLGNAAAFREALLQATTNLTTYQIMSKASYQHAQQYSWQQVAKTFGDAYDNTLA